MTQEKKVQTAMVMDVRQVKEALQDVVKTTGKAAEDIIRSGKAAGEGMDAIPEGLKKSEKQVETATKSISDSIRRMTRNAQRELAGLSASGAGGAGSATALQYETLLKGADLTKVQSQIAAYGELKATIDSLKAAQQDALAGTEVLNRIRERTAALQAQASAAKMTEADLLALKAAERGVAKEADPFIAKLREAEAAADAAALATRRKAEADRFVAGVMAQANAIGKSRADLIEMQAALNGTTKELAPYIAAIRRADGEMNGMGRSAKEMQWAMRGLPAQFTDIWVSLASGQSPMTVFIQQGGQLKDMFGGIGPAARAMGGYFIGLVNPFTVAAAAAGVLFAAFQSGSNEITKLNQAVILSGQKLGVTAGQLQDIAAAVAATGAGTQGAASEFLAMIAKDAKVSAEELGRFAQAALAMARVGGPAAEETAKAFSELGKDPLQASIKLTGQYNYLTKATFEQIKALEEQGRTTEAAAVAQKAFADFYQQRLPEMTEALGSIERGWIKVKSAIAEAWDSLKQIGRASTTNAQYESVNKQIEALQSGLGNFRGDAERRKQIEDEIERQRQRSNELRKQLELEQAGAIASKQRAEVNDALVRLSKFDAEYADKTKKAKKEIAEFERDALKAGKDRAYIEDGIAKIREKYADKKSGSAADPFAADRDAARQWAQFYKEFADAADKAEGRVGALTDGQVKLLQLLNSPAYQKASDAQRQDVLTQAYRQIAAEQANEALKEQAKISREAAREYEAWLKEQSRGAEQADKQARALRNEAEAQALVIPGYRSLETAIVMVEIARLRERQKAMLGNEDAVLAIQREIDARMKLVEIMTQRDVRKASEDQAKQAAAEWERTANSIRDSLTDALLRGFENGKDFAKNFRDTLVNMFKTLVLRPIIQAVVNPVAMAITGGLGIGGSASAATNIVAQQAGGGAGGVAQSLGTLYSSINGAFKSVGTSVALAADRIGEWLVLNTKGALNKAGGTLMQYAGQIGNFAQGAFAAVSNLGIKQMVAGDYRIGSGFNKVQDIGVAITSMINPALGAVVAAVSGIVNRAFGRAPKTISETGIEGTFMAGDATGEAFQNWVKKGGWFRSNKYGTDRTALDAELSAALDAGGMAVLKQTEAWAKALQLPAEYLTQVTTSFRVKLTGDAEKDKAAIAQVIQNYGVSLASIYEDVLQPLQREGENLADTLGRVSMLESFSRNLNQLGGVFSRVANLGIDVRESFIAMAGGMDELMKNALGFAQNYYSREEIAGLRANEILQALMSAGIGAAGDIGGSESRQEFRRLVESVDVSTETGRQQLATLLSVQGAFTDVADYLAETGATLAQAATQAPEAGPLTSLISPLQQQTDATNSLTGGMTNLRTSIERLIETMRQQVAAAMPAAAPAPAFAGWPSEVIDYSNPGGA